MDANSRQVGGNHYKGAEYQHWDWVCDIKLHYLPAVASKYISRCRRKNGLEDLQKAAHYVEKAAEMRITGSIDIFRARKFWLFVTENRLTLEEAEACYYLMEGDWANAISAVQRLIQLTEAP